MATKPDDNQLPEDDRRWPIPDDEPAPPPAPAWTADEFRRLFRRPS